MLHQLGHGLARPGRGEIDHLVAELRLRAAEHFLRRFADQQLGDIHHLDVIDVSLIELERGEFGIVPRRDAFVAEVAVDLEELVRQPADQQPLQMQLGRDAQVKLEIERVVMRVERFGRGTAGDRVQHRGFNFKKTTFDQNPADAGDDAAAAAQRLAAFLAHDQIEIALAIAQLDIGEAVEFLGQRQQRLGQDGDLVLLIVSSPRGVRRTMPSTPMRSPISSSFSAASCSGAR